MPQDTEAVDIGFDLSLRHLCKECPWLMICLPSEVHVLCTED